MSGSSPLESSHRECGNAVIWTGEWTCTTCHQPRRDTFGLERYATYRPGPEPSSVSSGTVSHTDTPIQVSLGQDAGANRPFVGFASYGKHPFLLQNVPPIARQNGQEISSNQELYQDSPDHAESFNQPHINQEANEDVAQPFIEPEYNETTNQPFIKREEPDRPTMPQHRVVKKKKKKKKSKAAARERATSPHQEFLHYPITRKVEVPCKRCKEAGKFSVNHFDHECKYLDYQGREVAWQGFLEEHPWQ